MAWNSSLKDNSNSTPQGEVDASIFYCCRGETGKRTRPILPDAVVWTLRVASHKPYDHVKVDSVRNMILQTPGLLGGSLDRHRGLRPSANPESEGCTCAQLTLPNHNAFLSCTEIAPQCHVLCDSSSNQPTLVQCTRATLGRLRSHVDCESGRARLNDSRDVGVEIVVGYLFQIGSQMRKTADKSEIARGGGADMARWKVHRQLMCHGIADSHN